MGMNARNRRSTWDNNKEENRISDRTSEQNARQERERYLRNLGRDPKSYNHRDAKRDSYDTARSRRPGDMASYPVSPRNHGPGQQNHICSPEGTWEHSRRSRSRSRSRSRGRGRGRSRSPSGGRNRSRSLSRGRERDMDYGRSRSPLNGNRRNPLGFFNDGRRGSHGRHHADNPSPRDRGRPERDHQGRRGGSRYDVEREDPARNSNLNVAPCKFYMMGDCSKSNCRFSHDAPMKNSRESGSREDRRDRDFCANNRKWTGPTWDKVEENNRQPDVINGGWGGPTWDNVTSGSECKNSTMIIKSHENGNDVELNRSVDESKNLTGPESKNSTGPERDDVDMDMDIAKPETSKEITKMEPNALYELSKPTSTVTHSVFSESSQIYSKMEENISIGTGFDCVDGENVFENAKQNSSKPGHDFLQLSDTCSLPPQQFGGIGEGQLVVSCNEIPNNGHNFEFNGPVENSIDNQHGLPVKPIGNESVPQTIGSANVSSIPPSLTEKIVSEQLPQLYTVLNPPKQEGSMPPVPDFANPVSIYQKRNGDDREPEKLETVAQNGDFMNTNRISSPSGHKKISPKFASEEPSKPRAEHNGAENVDADTKVESGATWKDEKAMRLFKNSLVEFVKDILKPKWKEGGMSKDVHKAIVKKVVDKVTSATQGVNIPSTQTKLDQYLQCSKPKLAKLVEAYVERCSKTS